MPRLPATSRGGVPWLRCFRAARTFASVMTRSGPLTFFREEGGPAAVGGLRADRSEAQVEGQRGQIEGPPCGIWWHIWQRDTTGHGTRLGRQRGASARRLAASHRNRQREGRLTPARVSAQRRGTRTANRQAAATQTLASGPATERLALLPKCAQGTFVTYCYACDLHLALLLWCFSGAKAILRIQPDPHRQCFQR